MRNKKGDVPITILVIGVVVICGLAILSFIASSFYFEQSFYGLSKMEQLNSQVDEYYFYLNQNLSSDKINSLFNISNNNFIIEERTSNLFPWSQSTKLFSVQFPIPHK